MMKKILVIYYSQSGQLKEIIESIVAPISVLKDVKVSYLEIKPEPSFPFPWKTIEFFDAFPESVFGTPCKLQTFEIPKNESFDLIFFAYQPWFLSPSIPASSFLQSKQAAELIKNTPVVTVIGCRNMWVMAQERVKELIHQNKGQLVGNIVLRDKANNFVSVATIMHWMFGGKKTRYLKIFPLPGVSEKDIRNARIFGETIKESILKNNYKNLQDNLLKQKSVTVMPDMVVMEKNAHRIFRIWAGFVLKKGGPKNPKREFRLRLFIVYLMSAIYILSPIVTLIFYITWIFRLKKVKRQKMYFSRVNNKM